MGEIGRGKRREGGSYGKGPREFSVRVNLIAGAPDAGRPRAEGAHGEAILILSDPTSVSAPPPPPFFNLEDPSILRSTLSSFLFTISEFGSLAKTEIDEQDSNFFFTHKIGVAFFGPGDLGFSDELDSPRSNNFFKLLGPGSRKMGEMEGVGR